ncbi:SnoaL-like domain-containing protein [Noviherbaspirillum humi]|uniref:SnoaL-like domain-containing protein n=1 Tax=Noviherbaspirillum humi TaxID=1688639 RepID=A0A239LIK3_9BURK|nr:nuclear transport factor 2 family protein [Noviherbaspirillum humi]SNT30195.1 SnoaL-like domain-containing protein [Noviherbaspirillum humi]
MDKDMEQRLRIAEVVQNWALWRDAGFWERFATVWHDDGWMSATWFQGPAPKFIAISKTGFEKGVSILHFLGGSTIDIRGKRAIAQTKMTINQRGIADDTLVDVLCTGRFYDFFELREINGVEEWRIVRRQPIYEKDRMDPVDPSATPKLDGDLLAQFPKGYQHLAYLQTRLGFKVKRDMPELTGPVVQALYQRGEKWLAGDSSPFDEPPVETVI